MHESTITDLKTAISRLETEKQRIDEQLRALETTLRYFENRERDDGPTQAFSAHQSSARVQVENPEHAQHRVPEGSLRDAMAEILAAEGPLHRREIYERLVRLGVPIGGQDPINNLSAHLSLDSRFENVGVGVWQLTEPQAEADAGGGDEEGDDVPW